VRAAGYIPRIPPSNLGPTAELIFKRIRPRGGIRQRAPEKRIRRIQPGRLSELLRGFLVFTGISENCGQVYARLPVLRATRNQGL
jgi:hypothetical protein